MTEGQHSAVTSFGLSSVGRQKLAARWTRPRPTDIFGATAFQYAPVDVAPDLIRKDIKSYIQGSYFQDPSTCLVNVIYDVGEQPHWTSVTPVFERLEAAISESRRILEIEAEPDHGIDVPYSEETWKRAVKLLRKLGELFWEDNGTFLPVPSIGPADAGSIDLFWELNGVTLLINVSTDVTIGATFFGRRLEASKISGTLGRNDTEPRHLTGWLSGRE